MLVNLILSSRFSNPKNQEDIFNYDQIFAVRLYGPPGIQGAEP